MERAVFTKTFGPTQGAWLCAKASGGEGERPPGPPCEGMQGLKACRVRTATRPSHGCSTASGVRLVNRPGLDSTNVPPPLGGWLALAPLPLSSSENGDFCHPACRPAPRKALPACPSPLPSLQQPVPPRACPTDLADGSLLFRGSVGLLGSRTLGRPPWNHLFFGDFLEPQAQSPAWSGGGLLPVRTRGCSRWGEACLTWLPSGPEELVPGSRWGCEL